MEIAKYVTYIIQDYLIKHKLVINIIIHLNLYINEKRNKIY